MLFQISAFWELEEAGIRPVGSFILVTTNDTAVISSTFLLHTCHDEAPLAECHGLGKVSEI